MPGPTDLHTVPAKALRVCMVVPCYNEAGVLQHTTEVLLKEMTSLAVEGYATADSYVCCVDDGSRDTTWKEIEVLSKNNARIKGLKLSANFGHQNAVIAGLFTERTHADILISMDADLQDDVSVISKMVKLHHAGKRVVYGVRLDRQVDSFGKQIAAKLYYSLIRKMNERAIKGHADFRSADSKVIADLERFNEANIYLRGLFPLIGYPSAEVEYVRKERHAGESKYSYRKLMSLAWQGITSFTTTPLKLVFYLGIAMMFMGIGVAVWVIWGLFAGQAIQGWASTLLIITIFSAMIITSLGIIGEYIGKIYQEVKQRPRYIIERTTGE
ncbi:MAG: glycosyltransferase family 2 protein [Flavobacteriales bacterium]|nr:glycosyltransferase family 2 protein [Flavobacteriales bacterium]